MENDSDLNYRSRDCIDDMFDSMLNGEELISSDISNVSATDTVCSFSTRYRRIVNTSCFDPLSQASSNSLYNCIEQSCKKLCHSWVGELHMANIQANEKSDPVDVISSP